jgi:hypothetical protein
MYGSETGMLNKSRLTPGAGCVYSADRAGDGKKTTIRSVCERQAKVERPSSMNASK